MRAILPFAILAAACSNTDPQPPAAPPPAPVPTAEATPVTPASASATPLPPSTRPRQKVGQMCAGFAGLRCEEGLHCVVDGPIHPDVSGVCQK